MVCYKFYGCTIKNILGRESTGLKVNSITSVLRGLKFINHCAAHLTSMRKSLLMIPSMSLIVAAELNNEVSSANNLVRLSSDSAISLIVEDLEQNLEELQPLMR